MGSGKAGFTGNICVYIHIIHAYILLVFELFFFTSNQYYNFMKYGSLLVKDRNPVRQHLRFL